MTLLVPADQPIYFPGVSQVGQALEGLLLSSQVYCESAHGANRPLEIQPFEQLLNVRSGRVELPISPVISIEAIDRFQGQGWASVPYTWEGDTIPQGRGNYTVYLNLAGAGNFGRELDYAFNPQLDQVRVRYNAGFNFSQAGNPDVNRIKSIAGQIATYFAKHDPWLNSSLSIDSTTNRPVSVNLMRLDTMLTNLLLPLKKYQPLTYGT